MNHHQPATTVQLFTKKRLVFLSLEAHNPDAFEAVVEQHFGAFRGFNVRRSESDPSAIVCQFFTDTFEIEIFGHNVPTERQNAYRHLIQINRVVTLGGTATREALRSLKLEGMKTEPAVAHLLKLDGDPYRAVLSLEAATDEEIMDRLKAFYRQSGANQ